jgi:O-antigen/teichoic acid export membrane protein
MKTARRRLWASGAWSFSSQVTRVGSLAIVMVALSRHFGPQRFGAFAFAMAFVRLFGVLAAFGLDRVIVRHLVEHPHARSTIVSRAFAIKLALGAASYVSMLLVCALCLADRMMLVIVALAGAGLFFQACDVFDFAFQAEHRFRLIFIGRAVPIMISTAIKIAALESNAPMWLFAALESVEAAFIALTLFLFSRRVQRGDLPAAAVSIPPLRLLGEGLPLLLTAFAVMIYMRADVILLGRLTGYAAAGIYSAASQISEGCALFPMAFAPALFPMLVRWRKQGADYYHRQFEKLFLGTIIAGVAISLGLTLSAPVLIPVVFGPSYAASVTVLRIMAWTPTFVFIGIMQTGYDITEGLTWLATLRTGVGALINVALNVVLIPRYGANGAAISTLISFACSAFLLNFAQSKTRPVFALQLRALLIWPVLFRPLRYE